MAGDTVSLPTSVHHRSHELHTLLPWNWRPIDNVELAEAA
jgi:hypothetical protein